MIGKKKEEKQEEQRYRRELVPTQTEVKIIDMESGEEGEEIDSALLLVQIANKLDSIEKLLKSLDK